MIKRFTNKCYRLGSIHSGGMCHVRECNLPCLHATCLIFLTSSTLLYVMVASIRLYMMNSSSNFSFSAYPCTTTNSSFRDALPLLSGGSPPFQDTDLSNFIQGMPRPSMSQRASYGTTMFTQVCQLLFSVFINACSQGAYMQDIQQVATLKECCTFLEVQLGKVTLERDTIK